MISIFALGGLAAGAMPLACMMTGSVFCAESGSDSAVDSSAAGATEQVADANSVQAASPSSTLRAPSPARGEGGTAGIEPGESSAALISAEPVQMAAAEAPTLTDNDLVAATFEALDVELTTTPGELTRRTVRTVTINPDGSVAGTESLVAEAAAPVDEASAEPAPVEVAAAEPETEVAASSESSEAVMAYAPVKGDAAEVTGKGANVRSLPQRGGSEVLFALPGGAAVTIVEMRQGWARVVDERGRSGWIYGEYLRRG